MDILDTYKSFVTFLGKVLNNNFEIALLDLRNGVNSITQIANGHVSGRMVGAPITDLALQILASESYKEKDFIVNYKGLTSNNSYLRSSTFFIKEDDKLIGMLCINVDMSCYTDICSQILSLGGANVSSIELFSPDSDPNTPVTSENFANNLTDSIEKIIKKCSYEIHTPFKRLTQDEKLEFVNVLSQTGLFMMKGSIPAVAEHLNCSEATVYRYLSKINKMHQTE